MRRKIHAALTARIALQAVWKQVTVAVVLARVFANGVGIASRLAAVGSEPANEGPTPAPLPIGGLRVRRRTADESRRFAVTALRPRGEMALAAQPL